MTVPVAIFDVEEEGELEVSLEIAGQDTLAAFKTWLTIESTTENAVQ